MLSSYFILLLNLNLNHISRKSRNGMISDATGSGPCMLHVRMGHFILNKIYQKTHLAQYYICSPFRPLRFCSSTEEAEHGGFRRRTAARRRNQRRRQL